MPTLRLLPAMLLVAAAACSDAPLLGVPPPPPSPIDNKLGIRGSFCTEDPSTVEFPVKIVFVVDTSQSMNVTDPPDPADGNYTGRARAITDVVNQLAGTTGVEVAVVGFSGAVLNATNGFTPIVTPEEIADVASAVVTFNTGTGLTNYEAALDEAYTLLVTDIAEADEIQRARSKYVVIFVSDGVPDPYVPPEELFERVEDIFKLEKERRLGEMRFHSVYLSGRTPGWLQAEPVNLLKEMARVGGGSFRNIGNGEKINFLSIDFTSFRRVFTLKSFVVSNLSARPLPDPFEAADSDGDTIPDVDEPRIGTDPAVRDSDEDGIHDGIEDRLRNAGFDPLDGSDSDCTVGEGDDYNRRDDDGDGLLNCEERFLGTNPRLHDTDGDGLPDGVEISAGVSPVAPDTYVDLDRDLVTNGVEVRDHVDPTRDDRDYRFDLRYRYDLSRTGIVDGRTCWEFNVSNISLAPTLAGPDGVRGVNEIRLVFGQIPLDTPFDAGTYRVACVRPSYLLPEDVKDPPGGRIELPPEAFKKAGNLEDRDDPEIFDPERDCVRP